MNKLISIFGLFIVVFILTGSIYAQVAQEWVARYNGPGNLSDGITSIAVDGSGNIYVTGDGFDAESGSDYVTIKYDSKGNTVWVARYNGTGNNTDISTSIAVDGSGNVYVTGYALNIYYDITTVKYNSSGVEQWVVSYDGIGHNMDNAYSIAVDGLGNVYVAGFSMGYNFDVGYVTIKYNSAGIMQWDRIFKTEYGWDVAYSIAVDGSGNAYVTGTTQSGDIATIKYKTNGDLEWAGIYNGPANGIDVGYIVKADALGNAYVTGQSHGIGTGYDGNDYVTIKYNSAGTEQWVARYDGLGNGCDYANSIAVDGTGNVYATGVSLGSGTGADIATVKYNAAGVLQWVARYNGPGNSYDDGYSIAVDGSGNIYVTGGSEGSGTGSDYVTIKYNSVGVEQWIQRYNGPGNNYDFVLSIALDGTGNVYVGGISTGEGTDRDFALIKYSQTPPIVHCGPNNDKILICHKGQELCISPNAVPAHLAHGDKLGHCGDNPEIITNNLPVEFKLNPNYPNPFNPVTKISFDIPKQTFVTLKIYDMLGREVRTLVNEVKAPGSYTVDFNGSELSSGVYFYRLQSADFTDIRRMLLIK